MNPRQPDVVTVAVSRADGGVTVLRVIVREYEPDTEHPTGRRLRKEYQPTTGYIDDLIAKYVADGHWVGPLAPTGWQYVANDYVDEATDRTFRNAWTHGQNGKPEVRMPHARELHRERLRAARAPLLESLDVEYQKADERNDQAAKRRVADRKQVLRDITAHPEIDAASTPEQLKAAAMSVLTG